MVQRGNSISDRVANLSPQKRALLEKLLQDNGPSGKGHSGQIFRRTGATPSVLSFAQERLWFMDQMVPGSHLWNLPIAMRLQQALDPSHLERCLNEIIRRHEILRTTFVAPRGQPLQVVSPALRLSLPVLDLRHLSRAEQQREALRLANEEARRPFDLSQGPLLRVSLIRLEGEEYVLLLTMHHIISDAWSIAVFFRELNLLNDAFARGVVSPLPEVPIQYADFAIWQRQWLRGPVLEQQLTYWKKQLANIAPLQLPTDRPRSDFQSHQGAYHTINLHPAEATALKAVGQAQGVTLYMLLLAAFTTLLYRYTGQADVAVGSPVAGRDRAETESLIGFFVNTLVLRTNLRADPTFGEVLRRVRETTLGAFAHQDMPFEKLVEELHPQRDLSRSPLFQVMFQFFSAPHVLQQAATHPSSSNLEVRRTTAIYDLVLSLAEDANGLSGGFEYSTDLFDAETIARMADHFKVLLRGITSGLEQPISKLPLMTDVEHQQLLVKWNTTDLSFPGDSCIHELFEAQVEVSPQAGAVVGQQEQLSYRELDERANQLAHHLRALGVRVEDRVGICVERTPDMIVALLATLKAGGSYVPLDPEYPKDRLSFMLSDAAPKVLITYQSLLPKLPENRPLELLLDAHRNDITRLSSQRPMQEAGSTNLAYIIYTSGSTGKPKGVMIEHRGLCNVAAAQIQTLNLGPADRILQFASMSFDASVAEIVMALAAGAALYVGPRESMLAGPPLQNFIREHRITVATLPPSVAATLDPDELPSLRTLIVAGEACGAGLLTRWLPGRRVFNFYGPTEATIWSTAAVYDSANQLPSIGRPIANTRIYLLDSKLELVPIGVPGELHIGGVGLARGYLNQPDLTAKSFIRNPFSDQPESRLYKTGDLARYRSDGNIEFLGRLDHQVKIRGFRIELEEIESTLRLNPRILEAVAIVPANPTPASQLVAYIVAQQPAPTVSELREFVRAKLPEQMVPGAFVLLDKMPLTSNGKIDRRALAERGVSTPPNLSQIAPRSEMERSIARVWQEALQVEKVGIHDNFFDLGGHSLLMVQVQTKLKQVLEKDLSIVDLFRYPTIELLAQHLSQGRYDKGEEKSFPRATTPTYRSSEGAAQTRR